MEYDDRIKLNVLEGKTTYSNDFRKYKYDKMQIFDWPSTTEERRAKRTQEVVYKNTETFQPWFKGKHIEFDLLWQPKEITRTNPFDVLKNREKPAPKLVQEEPLKVVPKCLVPAININEIERKEDRDMLIKFMYTTEFKEAMEESSGLFKSKPASKYSEVGTFTVCKNSQTIPPVPEDKIDKIKDFDKAQIRAIAEPSILFWNEQSETENSDNCPIKEITQDVKDNIRELIKKDELRLPYDYAKPGYEGYMPRLAKGVTLEKGDKPVTHPRMTVSQALTKRYAEDILKK